MFEKKIHKLEIDLEFKKLIPPLSNEEKLLLEENIIRDGCREPICVWNNTIIDGHNRYEICCKNQIPFFIQEIKFKNRAEIKIWICVNQLGRRNISNEIKKYLIGKRYQMEKLLFKNPNGNNQYTIEQKNENLIYTEESRKNRTSVTAIRLGHEYQIASRTVVDYSNYAKSLDILEKTEPTLVAKILSGDLKIGQKRVIKLSKQNPKIKNKLQKYLKGELTIQEPVNSQNTIHKITVKDMPQYDPDAEVVSLTFTIPSWIGSIDRVLEKESFENVSTNAKENLKTKLNNLKFSVDTMLIAMEGV